MDKDDELNATGGSRVRFQGDENRNGGNVRISMGTTDYDESGIHCRFCCRNFIVLIFYRVFSTGILDLHLVSLCMG
jgi:hypothetical protein